MMLQLLLRVQVSLFVFFLSLPLISARQDASCITQALSKLESSRLVEHQTKLVVHRNGEPESCGTTALFDQDAFERASQAIVTKCRKGQLDKYEMESILTAYLKDQLLDATSCGSTDNATAPEGLAGFCDMGSLRTTIQPDHNLLVKQPDGSLPCRFFTREGRRISGVDDLVELADRATLQQQEGDCQEGDQQTCSSDSSSLHLYAVPAGRMFMFAPSHVGEKFVLDHVQGNPHNNSTKLVVETISLEPRLFEIYDFFSLEEADQLIDKALKETNAEFGMHRSQTGAIAKSVITTRTSENAWDTNGKVARQIKERCMEMLGFDEYWDGHTDGLQILRYQNTQAYNAHHDYLPRHSKQESYNYDSAHLGGNRFATVLLYMTDIEDGAGGNTVFEGAKLPGASEMPSRSQALQLLRASGDPKLDVLTPGSWEESMTAMCRTRLNVQPRAGRAVLFYSQHPNGAQDTLALHGACPVLNGTKWAANLWVWNAPREGYSYAPHKGSTPEPLPGPNSDLFVSFYNHKKDPRYKNAEIYYQDDTNFGPLGHGGSFRAKTFRGHVWNIKVEGKTVKTFVISGKKEEEVFVI